jgi:cytochrome c oxidase cbb3-type subunit 3
MKHVHFFRAILIASALMPFAGGQPPTAPSPAKPVRSATGSPAAQPRPKSLTPQTYPAAQIRDGGVRFGAACGFCHGKDAAGGESGTDLTRAEIVSKDVRGDLLIPVIRDGRVNAGMPAFKNISDTDMAAIVAFLHSQMDTFAQALGGRRTVDVADLATGNAEAGKTYFNGTGKCNSCHSTTGDLAGIGTRMQGLNLMRRMLYPGGGGPGSPGATKAKAKIQMSSGETMEGPLAAEDDFSVTILDASGARKVYQKSAAKVKVDDPLDAHFVQLGKYTDADMHNVYAYLVSLK